MIEPAKQNDIEMIARLATKTREHMLANGLQQWTGNYPSIEYFQNDFDNKGLFVYRKYNEIYASATILPENDEAYKEITWLKKKSLVIHRVIVDPHHQREGIGIAFFEYAKEMGRNLGYESVKVDTHPDNSKMQGLIAKAGFVPVGYLSGINRLAYECVL